MIIIFTSLLGICNFTNYQEIQKIDAKRPLYQQIVTRPTGQNGYEEYLRAADILRTQTAKDLEENVLEDGTLEAKKKWVQHCDQAIKLVRAGNIKPVYDPRNKVTMGTPFPEFSYFRKLGRLLTASIYANFAEGNPVNGVQTLLDTLTFSTNMGKFLLISHLVGNANIAFVLAQADDRLPQLSLRDAEKIEVFINEWFRKPYTILEVIENERQLSINYLNEMLSNSKTWDDTLFSFAGTCKSEDECEDNECKLALKFMEQLKKLSYKEKHSLVDACLNKIDEDYQAWIKVLSGPEKGWSTLDALEQDRNPQNAFEWFEDVTRDFVMPAGAFSTARIRTQLRLLRLHANIIQYRWLYGYLPKSLNQLSQQSYIEDPLTAKTFVYNVLSDKTYELYSEGDKRSGRIDLKYKRKTNSSLEDGAPPIP